MTNVYIKAIRFNAIRQASILQSRQTCKTGRLAVVAGKQKPQALVDTLVD